MVETSDGILIIYQVNYKYFIKKFFDNGTTGWTKTLDLPNVSISELAGSTDLLLAGVYSDSISFLGSKLYSTDKKDFFLFRVSSDLTTLKSAQTIDIKGEENIRAIENDYSGIYFSGSFVKNFAYDSIVRNSNNYIPQAFILKIDNNQGSLWMKHYSDEDMAIWGGKIKLEHGKVYWFTQQYLFRDVNILTSNGQLLARKGAGDGCDFDPDGNSFYGYNTCGHYTYCPTFKKFDPSDQLLWEFRMTDGTAYYNDPRTFDFNIRSFSANEDGSVFLIGNAGRRNNRSKELIYLDRSIHASIVTEGYQDMILSHVDATGKLKSTYQLGSAAGENAKKIFRKGNSLFIIGESYIDSTMGFNKSELIIGPDTIKTAGSHNNNYFIGKASISPVSVNETKVASSILIYPNPATDILSIANGISVKQLVIYNALGKSVLTTQKTDQVNIKDLPPGSYQVKLETSEGIEVKRFIKL